MSTLKDIPTHLAEALRAARRLAVWAGAFSFFVDLLMLTGPLYMLQIYDRVIASRSYPTLVVITILAIVLFAAMAALDFARSALLARAGSRFEARLQSVAFDFSMDAARVGVSAADRTLKDVRQLRQFFTGPALIAVFDAPWTPLFLAVIFMMHWLLGVVALAGLLILLVLAVVNEKYSRNANDSAQRLTFEADRIALSAMKNVAAADAMGIRAPLKAHWTQLNDTAVNHSLIATDIIGGLTASSKAFRLFLQSAMLGTGAFLAINDHITAGAMIAASIIAGRALAPIEVVTSQWRNFASAISSYERLTKFIAAARPQTARTALPKPAGRISVEKVYCQPRGAKKPVLKNITFQLEPGRVVGVIGPSAAGKSTLARALVGVEHLSAGEIRIDGANFSQWDPAALGPHIGFLPQEVELFEGTARQNIARHKPDSRDEDVIAAAKAAGAHEMILSFPDGYDTDIGEGGRHLSAGQRQRLGLARALFGEPAFVVLDEPNAALDADGEAALTEAIKELKARGATTVIVAHRPSAIAFVDSLMLIVEGELKAFGPRDEILARLAPRQVSPFKRSDSSGEAASA